MTPILFIIIELLPLADFPDSTRPGDERILYLALPMPILTLDPYEYSYGAQNEIFPFIYSFLLVPNRDGTFSPDLAMRWTSSDHDLTWEFILRPEARFHNNRPVLATDVAYSLKKIFQYNVILAEAVDRIETPYPHRVILHLKHRVPHLLYQLSVESIVPEPLPEVPDLDEQPIGSGPFRVLSRLDDRQIILARFDQYYGTPPNWDSIEINYVPSEEKIWRDLMLERTYFSENISAENVPYLHVEPGRYELEGRLSNKATVLLFNTHRPPLADRDIRKSLARMIDLEEHIRNDLRGMAKPCPGPLGFQSPYLPADVDQVRPDWAWAEKTLEGKGWVDHDGDGYRDRDGQNLDFDILLSPHFDADRKTADYVQLAFNQFGVRANLIEKRYDRMIEENLKTGDFQACFTWHNTNHRLVNGFVRTWASGAKGDFNYGRYQNPAVDQSLSELPTKDNEEDYSKILRTFHQQLVNDQPAVWLVHNYIIHGHSGRLQGYTRPNPEFYPTYHLIHAWLAPRPTHWKY
ncbi:MAG: hypothetical protein HQK55_06380 [Deltaproteobacteria bacterium]|nr:hypothetical protein [Deltaproteobacteria bacterium]